MGASSGGSLPKIPTVNLNQDLKKSNYQTLQKAAVNSGAGVQKAATDLGSMTGMKNETLEKIASSNVKGAEASLSNNVKGIEALSGDASKAAENAKNQVAAAGASIGNPFQSLMNSLSSLGSSFKSKKSDEDEQATGAMTTDLAKRRRQRGGSGQGQYSTILTK
jgi:fructose-bisphosphate aldolase class 1